jgi:hypothetical protein
MRGDDREKEPDERGNYQRSARSALGIGLKLWSLADG